jgi:hypothetical protein
MTVQELEKLRPEIDFVIFAKHPYRVAKVRGSFIEIYDEEPHNLHVDMVKAESCKYISRKDAFKVLASED